MKKLEDVSVPAGRSQVQQKVTNKLCGTFYTAQFYQYIWAGLLGFVPRYKYTLEGEKGSNCIIPKRIVRSDLA